ncbi:MAG: hypothetical protein ACTSQJ_12845 [Promethearchaeota archaeon]
MSKLKKNTLKSENSEPENINTEEFKVNETVWLQRKSFRITLTSTFTALAVVLGYMLIFLPNIELFCMMIFLSGFIMGKRDGAIIGLMSSFIFCFFNPIGASPLPLLAFQMIYYSTVGILGGLIFDIIHNKDFFNPEDDLYTFPILLLFGFIGAIITFTFDIISTVLLALTVFGTINAFLPNYIIGLPFTTIHLISNTLVFIFILPGLIQLMYKMLDISDA